MEKIAVFVDEPAHAALRLNAFAPAASPRVEWLVVACAPRLSRHIGRWVHEAAREQWQQRWMRSLRESLAPAFSAAPVEWLLARGSLPRVVDRLRVRHGAGLRLLDLRVPRPGGRLSPLTDAAGVGAPAWPAPVAAASGLSLLLALTD